MSCRSHREKPQLHWVRNNAPTQRLGYCSIVTMGWGYITQATCRVGTQPPGSVYTGVFISQHLPHWASQGHRKSQTGDHPEFRKPVLVLKRFSTGLQDGSVVKNTHCFCRGPSIHVVAHKTPNSSSRGLMLPCLRVPDTYMIHIYTQPQLAGRRCASVIRMRWDPHWG